MSFVLMLVGILATALGAILIGFGIPINEFSLGNTLILAGTVTAAGGVIVFALSRVLGQLARISEQLGNRPLATAVAPPADPFAQPATPAPRPRADVPVPMPRAPEPRVQASEFDLPHPPRAPMHVEEQEDVPLSPRAPTRGAPPAPEPAAPTGWRPPRPSVEPQPKPEPRRPAAPQHGADTPLEAGWPGRKPAAPARREPVVEPVADAPAEAPKPEPVSILKSGVVDGMAYTLYTDGSIEAELAQGVVRFGSIEELRNHLEKSA